MLVDTAFPLYYLTSSLPRYKNGQSNSRMTVEAHLKLSEDKLLRIFGKVCVHFIRPLETDPDLMTLTDHSRGVAPGLPVLACRQPVSSSIYLTISRTDAGARSIQQCFPD